MSVSGHNLADYDLIALTFTMMAGYYTSVLKPDGNSYYVSGFQTTVNISGSYANSVQVASGGGIRSIYGWKSGVGVR